jgi:hypothetical protein
MFIAPGGNMLKKTSHSVLDFSTLNPKKLNGFIFSILVAFVVSASPAMGQDFSALEKLLREAGYQLYNPPRANWGPGFVFTGDTVNGRITNVEEVCPNLYSNMGPLKGSTVILADYHASDSMSFNAAVDFLKSLTVGALNLGGAAQRTVDVRWKNVQEFSYTHIDKWLKTGEPRPVEKRCRAAIDDLKVKNRFKDRVFVMVRAVAPEVLIYDFSKMAEADAKASAKLIQELNAAAEGKGHLGSETQLLIEKQLYLGHAAPIKIDEWLPTHLQSGDIIQIRGTDTDLSLEE